MQQDPAHTLFMICLEEERRRRLLMKEREFARPHMHTTVVHVSESTNKNNEI